MLTLPTLPPERQRNVGLALQDFFGKPNQEPAAVAQRAQAVIEATAGLKDSDEHSLFIVDGATDSVLTALHRICGDVEKALVDTVVPLGPEQIAHAQAAQLCNDSLFPEGIEFTRDSTGVQHGVMIQMRDTLNDPEKGPPLSAALTTLGLKPIVDHLLLHLDLYSKKLGLVGSSVIEPTMDEASRAWHEAYVVFAATVVAAHAADPAAQKALLGTYDKQLEEHRADKARARRRARKAQAEALKKAQAEAQAALQAEAAKQAEATKTK